MADGDLHAKETEPLNSNLENAQQGRKATQSTNLSATRYILEASREHQDIGQRRCGGCRSQENEVRGNAVGAL